MLLGFLFDHDVLDLGLYRFHCLDELGEHGLSLLDELLKSFFVFYGDLLGPH